MRSEHETESDLGLFNQEFGPDKGDDAFIHVREGIEYKRIEWQASSLLFKRASSYLLVRVLKHIEGSLDIQRVKERSVSDIYPFDHISQVLHTLSLHFEERKLR